VHRVSFRDGIAFRFISLAIHVPLTEIRRKAQCFRQLCPLFKGCA
jgi:hypothetical protein